MGSGDSDRSPYPSPRMGRSHSAKFPREFIHAHDDDFYGGSEQMGAFSFDDEDLNDDEGDNFDECGFSEGDRGEWHRQARGARWRDRTNSMPSLRHNAETSTERSVQI